MPGSGPDWGSDPVRTEPDPGSGPVRGPVRPFALGSGSGFGMAGYLANPVRTGLNPEPHSYTFAPTYMKQEI